MVVLRRIQHAVSIDELVVGLEKGGVSRYGMIKKLNRLSHDLLLRRMKSVSEEQSLGPGVEVEGGQVGGGRLFDRRLLARRKLRLELFGNGFSNLALDREHIGQIAIVSLRPQMRVGPGID